MADLRKPHHWIVGCPGDPNSTEVKIAGKTFLAIPYTFLQAVYSPGLKLESRDMFYVGTAQKGDDLLIEPQYVPYEDWKLIYGLSAFYQARNCRKPTQTDIWKLDDNVENVCKQLGVKERMHITVDKDNASDLPVMRPVIASTMKPRHVYVFARRR